LGLDGISNIWVSGGLDSACCVFWCNTGIN